jgi:N-formylglutamate amidohydrolase
MCKAGLKKKWQRVDLNRRPRAYDLASGKTTSGLLGQPLASFLDLIIEKCHPKSIFSAE